MFRSRVVASTTKLAFKLRAFTNSPPNFADPSHLKSGGWKGKFEKLKENRFLIFVGAGVAAVAGSVGPLVLSTVARSGGVNDAISLAVTAQDYLKELTHSVDKAVFKIPEDPAYVARANLEGILESTTSLEPTGSYYVIYGAKGAGKSKLTCHVAKGRKATIRVTVTAASKQEHVLSILAEELLGKAPPLLNVDKFVRAVDNCENTPLIVFDVERSNTMDQRELLGAVRGVCKALAHKCVCWIVLSEANAVLAFGQDSERQKFIYVDEMNKEEARKFVNTKLNPPVDVKKKLTAAVKEPIEILSINDKDFEYVYNTVGGNPAMLVNLAQAVQAKASVQDFVSSRVASASQDLLAFAHQPILKALKKKPDGVSPKFFKKQEHKGVDLSDPIDVGLAMKRSNAIVYRKELNEYQLMTTAHRTALKAYDPIVT
jgi:hypothetical protein